MSRRLITVPIYTTHTTTWNNQLDPNKCTCPNCGNSNNKNYYVSHSSGSRMVTCAKCGWNGFSSSLITKIELRKKKLLKIEKYEN